MKTTNLSVIVYEKKAADYVCTLSPIQAKKTFFALTQLRGDERLSDSRIPELSNIAEMYDGIVQSKYAKELASRLAKTYAETHPGTLSTKKQLAQYTDARYRKLIDAVGEYGFEYVMAVLRIGKGRISMSNEVDERQMLKAMRWVEQRDTFDAVLSDEYHHRKGLELVGFDAEMIDYLVDHSFAIANVYEIVTPQVEYWTARLKPAEDLKDEHTVETAQLLSVRQMKVHFIEQAEFIEAFYNLETPVVPDGYAAEDLADAVFKLAEKGLLTNSEEVLNYRQQKSRFDTCYELLAQEFDSAEIALIEQKRDAVKELIKDTW